LTARLAVAGTDVVVAERIPVEELAPDTAAVDLLVRVAFLRDPDPDVLAVRPGVLDHDVVVVVLAARCALRISLMFPPDLEVPRARG
jgi:hypothetical protein